MVRVLQWVALSGVSCVVFRTTSWILAAVIVGVLPGRRSIFLQTGEAFLQEPLTPSSSLLIADINGGSDFQILLSVSRQQDDLARAGLGGRAKTAIWPTVPRSFAADRRALPVGQHACKAPHYRETPRILIGYYLGRTTLGRLEPVVVRIRCSPATPTNPALTARNHFSALSTVSSSGNSTRHCSKDLG